MGDDWWWEQQNQGRRLRRRGPFRSSSSGGRVGDPLPGHPHVGQGEGEREREMLTAVLCRAELPARSLSIQLFCAAPRASLRCPARVCCRWLIRSPFPRGGNWPVHFARAAPQRFVRSAFHFLFCCRKLQSQLAPWSSLLFYSAPPLFPASQSSPWEVAEYYSSTRFYFAYHCFIEKDSSQSDKSFHSKIPTLDCSITNLIRFRHQVCSTHGEIHVTCPEPVRHIRLNTSHRLRLVQVLDTIPYRYFSSHFDRENGPRQQGGKNTEGYGERMVKVRGPNLAPLPFTFLFCYFLTRK